MLKHYGLPRLTQNPSSAFLRRHRLPPFHWSPCDGVIPITDVFPTISDGRLAASPSSMGDAKTETFLPSYLQENSVVKVLQDTYTSFSQRREALGLSNPGAADKISREVDTDVFLTKYMFTGLKADLSRPLSMLPLFQYSHSFALGSQQIPPYGFSALFGTQGVRMQ